MDWDDLRYFLALSRAGSVRAAGSALGVSHSTVARRVEALEERLSVRLFDRTSEGYALTDSGRQMVPSAELLEEEVNALERSILGRDERFDGVVRVTCADAYLSELVVRELAPFCKKYPEIDLEITHSYRSFDLSKREADIALRIYRMDKQPPEHLLGRKLTTVAYANYVSRAHEERLDPERSDGSRWLGWSERSVDEVWARNSSYPKLPVWGSFGSTALQLQAAHAGLGVANLPCYVADDDPNLRRLKKDDLKTWYDIWMLSHPDLRDTARLRAVRELLTASFKRETPRFLGQADEHRPA
jgi:DNA-binding transcriptional LysR family regulator